MWQQLRQLGAALLVMAACCLPARAQESDNPFLKKMEKGPPVAEFAVASIATMLVLVVVCMPSRKR